MSAIRAEAEIGLRDNFSPQAKRISESLQQIDNKSRTAFAGMSSASQNAASQMKRTAAEINNTRVATIGMTTSIAGLGASFVALETTMTNIPKRLKAIEGAEVALARVKDTVAVKNNTLQRLELTLTKAKESGKKSAEEIELIEGKIAVTRQQLATYTADLAVKQEDLNLKHADYADTLKLMTTSVFTTFLTAGSSITIMLTQMATAADMTTGAFVKSKLATMAHSNVLKLLRVDLAGASLAFRGLSISATAIGTPMLVASTGIKRVGLAVKGLYLALGPIGWAIIGITVAFEAWNANIFGVQEKIAELWTWLKKLMPPLQALEAVVATVFPGTKEEVTELNTSLEQTNTELTQLGDGLDEMQNGISSFGTAVGAATVTMSGFSAEVAQTNGAVQLMYDLLAGKGIDDISQRVNVLITTFQDLRQQGIDPLSPAWRQASDVLIREADQVYEAIHQIFGADTAAEFKSNIASFGIFGAEQMKMISMEAKAAAKEVDNLKKNYDKLETRTGIKKDDDILRNKPTGKVQSDHLDTLREAVQRVTNDELSRIRNRAGVITSLADQSLNFRFAKLQRELQKEIRLKELQIRDFSARIEDRTKVAISSHMAKTQNNFRSPHFRTGGRRPGTVQEQNRAKYARKGRPARTSGGLGGVAKYSRQRWAAKQDYERAANKYKGFFGETALPRMSRAPRRGVTSFFRDAASRLMSALDKARDQLARFPVEADYSPRYFDDLVKTIHKVTPVILGGRKVPIHWTQEIRGVTREPVKKEAVEQSLQESEEREQTYTELVDPHSSLAEIEKRAPVREVLKYNAGDTAGETVEEEVVLHRLAYRDRIMQEPEEEEPAPRIMQMPAPAPEKITKSAPIPKPADISTPDTEMIMQQIAHSNRILLESRRH